MKILGIVIIVMALVMATVPQFTNCDSQGKALTTTAGKTVPMKCLWTARAELALGIPLLAVGAMMTMSRRRETKRALSVSGLILGVFALLVPTYLIGVCATPTMLCVTAEKPAILASGSIAVIGSLIGIVFAQRSKEKQL